MLRLRGPFPHRPHHTNYGGFRVSGWDIDEEPADVARAHCLQVFTNLLYVPRWDKWDARLDCGP